MAANNVKITATFQDNASASVAQLNAAVKQLNDTAAQLGAQTAGVNSFSAAIKGAGDQATKSLNDTGHASAGVTREIIVLGHEMLQGNFSRIPGSFMVLTERSKGLQDAFKMLAGGSGVVGLAMGATIAAALGVGYAMYEADKQTKAFAATLALTGNIAGLNKSNFDALTSSLATTATVSFGKAQEAMMGIANAGVFTQQQIALLGPLVVTQSRLSGESLGKVTEQFAKLAEGPTKFMNAYNTTHPIFTAKQQEEITQLEATGHKQEAVTIALQAYTAYYNGPGKEGLESQIGMWARLKKQLGDNLEAIGLMSGIIPKSLEQQLVGINKQIEEMQARKGKHDAVDFMGNPLEFDQKALDNLLAKRLQINDAYVAEMKKSNKELQAAQDSKNAQEVNAEVATLGIKTKKRMDMELSALAETIKKAKALKDADKSYNNEALDPNWQRQAEEAIKAKYRNPIDDSAARKAFQESIAKQDALLKQQADAYTNAEAKIKERLAAGVIDQKQAADAIEGVKKNELAQQIDIVNQKIKLAEAEVKRSGGKDALTAVVQYNEELKHLRSLEVLAGIEHDIKVDEADKNALEKKKVILAELTRIETEIAAEATSSANAFQKDISKITMSADEAALGANLDKVRAKFDAMRASATAALTRENADPAVMVKALQTISDAETKQLAQETQYYNQKKAITNDWKTGAIKAYQDYQAAAENQAKNFQTLMNSITSGLESSIENFLTTGKLSLASLEQSFTQTLNKMVAQALAAKLQQALFGSLTGGGGGNWATTGLGMLGSMFGGGRASGGSVDAGKIYQVNEQGPEFFKPSVSGTVIPMGQMKSQANGTTVHLAINAVDAPSFRNLVQSDGRFIADLVNKTTRAYNLGV